MKIHEGQPVLQAGAELSRAKAALILLHGRGASAEDILSLGVEVAAQTHGIALLAPQAAGHTWYPQRFLAPLEQNEPSLGSALGIIEALLGEIARHEIPAERVLLLGFSQGACLALEYAARHPRRYGGVAGLSGALIGPPGTVRPASSLLEGTPVYLGCGDRDFHIPVSSVAESAEIFRHLGAVVHERIFPGMSHLVNEEEIAAVQVMTSELTAKTGN